MPVAIPPTNAKTGHDDRADPDVRAARGTESRRSGPSRARSRMIDAWATVNDSVAPSE